MAASEDLAKFRTILNGLTDPVYRFNRAFDPPDHIARGASGYPARWWWPFVEWSDADPLDMAGGDNRSGTLSLVAMVQLGAAEHYVDTMWDAAETAVANQSTGSFWFGPPRPEEYGPQAVEGASGVRTEWSAWGLHFQFRHLDG